MTDDNDFLRLPAGLPAPVDDGAAAHLRGARLQPVELPATSGRGVYVDRIGDPAVLFIFPMIANPPGPLPWGWDSTPGARGCTPEACGFGNLWNRFDDLGVTVVGISAQPVDDQREAKDRLHLPYELLSDVEGRLRRSLSLPTFELHGTTYLKRMTLVVRDGLVARLYYPVFPPDQHPETVLHDFEAEASGRSASDLSGES